MLDRSTIIRALALSAALLGLASPAAAQTQGVTKVDSCKPHATATT